MGTFGVYCHRCKEVTYPMHDLDYYVCAACGYDPAGKRKEQTKVDKWRFLKPWTW